MLELLEKKNHLQQNKFSSQMASYIFDKTITFKLSSRETSCIQQKKNK